MAIITLNGKTFMGKVISIKIDDQVITTEEKNINISIQGDVDSLHVDACSKLDVTGNVKKLSTTSGDIKIGGNVEGGITSVSGDVTIKGNITGNIQTVSGDVSSGETIKGNVSTISGDIN